MPGGDPEARRWLNGYDCSSKTVYRIYIEKYDKGK